MSKPLQVMRLLGKIKNLDRDLKKKLLIRYPDDVEEKKQKVDKDEAQEALDNIEKSLQTGDAGKQDLGELSKKNSLLFSNKYEKVGDLPKQKKKARNSRKKRDEIGDSQDPSEYSKSQEENRQEEYSEQEPKRRKRDIKEEKSKKEPSEKAPEIIKTRENQRGREGDNHLEHMREIIQGAKSEIGEKEALEKARKTSVNLTPEGKVEGYYGKGDMALKELKQQLGRQIDYSGKDRSRKQNEKSSKVARGETSEESGESSKQDSSTQSAREKYIEQIQDFIERQMEEREDEEVIERAMKTPVQVDSSGDVKGYFGSGKQAFESLKKQMAEEHDNKETSIDLSTEELDSNSGFKQVVQEMKKLEKKIEHLESKNQSINEKKHDLSIIRDLRSVVIDNRQDIQDLKRDIKKIKKDEESREKIERLQKRHKKFEKELEKLGRDKVERKRFNSLRNDLEERIKEIHNIEDPGAANKRRKNEETEKKIKGLRERLDLKADEESLENLEGRMKRIENILQDLREESRKE